MQRTRHEESTPASGSSSGTARPAVLSLLDGATRAELNQVAKAAPAAVTLLVGRQRDLALAVGSTLARFWVPDRDAATLDVVVAVPDGRWTIEQVRHGVLDQLTTVPLSRRVVVVDRVDELDENAADTLLKAIEEPGTDTVFVLLTATVTALQATLRGRVVTTVHLAPAGAAERAALLVDASTGPDVAAEAVRLAGDLVVLAPLLAGDPILLGAAVELEAARTLSATKPVTAAERVVDAVEKLSDALGEQFGGGDRGVRAAKRALVEQHVEELRAVAVRAAAPAADGRTGDLSDIGALLEECDRTMERHGTHAPLAVNLSALHLRHAALRRS